VLHRCALEVRGELNQGRFPRGAVVRRDPDLHEFMLEERQVDLVQHGGRESVLPDEHDGVEMMGLRAQRAALGGTERLHRPSVPRILAGVRPLP